MRQSLETERHSRWKLAKLEVEVPTPSPSLLILGPSVVLYSEKTEGMASSLGHLFKPVNDPSMAAVFENFDEAIRD
jgi:hypothetical protein